MYPLSYGKRRLVKAGRLALACLAVAALIPSSLVAAPPTGDRIYYTNQRTFLIPFTPEPGATGIQQVFLYVSTDDGRTYSKHASGGPNEKSFKFSATVDGWYWFSVQTQDSAGRFFRPNVNLVAPGLKVYVDTLPPAIYLKQIATTEKAAAFEWDIREENPDFGSLRADYRAVGSRDWTPLTILPRLQGQFAWNPTVKGPWEVRLQMHDKAGNPGEQTTTVASTAWRPDMNTATPNPVRPNVIMVNSKQIELKYKIDNVGKSDISTVQIWYTENDGRTWTKFPKEATREGPFSAEVTHEGLYGFFVVPVSGVGLSDPPSAGMTPQVSVEVDWKAPVVTLLGAPLVGTGADINKVTIRYQATDKNFGATPIKIQWRGAKAPMGEWADVAVNQANEGVYVWTVPDSVPAQFHIRVEAVDLAGNVGHADTPTAVNVDPVKPRATITGVEAVKPTMPE